jgi:hypothetical protein
MAGLHAKRKRRRRRGGAGASEPVEWQARFRGWVYVIDNEAMPRLIKIGFTLGDPVGRASELRSTGNPFPFVVQYHALVDNPRGLERAVHEKLKKHRGEGEWFEASLSQAIAAIRECAASVLFEDEAPRWHPAHPVPSESSRTRLQRERESLEREKRCREQAELERRSRESAERERSDRERREREAVDLQRRERERADAERREKQRQERMRAARIKGDDYVCSVSITKAQSIFGCRVPVASARGGRLEFKCPPGIPDGSRVRLRGQGHQSQDGGPPGDLIVIVRVYGG